MLSQNLIGMLKGEKVKVVETGEVGLVTTDYSIKLSGYEKSITGNTIKPYGVLILSGEIPYEFKWFSPDELELMKEN